MGDGRGPASLFSESSCQQVALTAVWEINQSSTKEAKQNDARVDHVFRTLSNVL